MNHRPLIEDKIIEFSKGFPEYTFGEILFSILTQACKNKTFTKTVLLELTDDHFYTAVSKSYSIESGERELTEDEMNNFLNK